MRTRVKRWTLQHLNTVQWPFAKGEWYGDFLLAGGDPEDRQAPEPEPTVFPLTIRADPSDARMRILNIQSKYRSGMRLKPGDYQLEVSRNEYRTHTEWISHGREAQVVRIQLEKERRSRAIEPEMVRRQPGRRGGEG